MKKIKNEFKFECGGANEKKSAKGGEGKTFPLRTREIAIESLKVGRKIFKKLREAEELIEMIAREIKRQLDRQT